MSSSLEVTTPNEAQQKTAGAGESLDEKVAHYGSPEFTKALTEHFHQAKRRALQAQGDLETTSRPTKVDDAAP